MTTSVKNNTEQGKDTVEKEVNDVIDKTQKQIKETEKEIQSDKK